MKKSVFWSLLIVMLTALLLMILFTTDYLNCRNELNLTRAQWNDSRTSWEKTAAAKEELQEKLKLIQNDVKEATLSLSESNERAEELRLEIETLKKLVHV